MLMGGQYVAHTTNMSAHSALAPMMAAAHSISPAARRHTQTPCRISTPAGLERQHMTDSWRSW